MPPLQSLPEDVKHLICAELESDESLRSLWQVSKDWRIVADSFVYRKLDLSVSSKEGLRADTRLLVEDAVASKYLKYARSRCIYIHGNPALPTKAQSENKATGIGPTPATFSVKEPASPRFNEVFVCDGDQDRETAQEAWEPLVSLLPFFKHLTDIVIQISSQFPPGLLATLENHHPACRLHLRKFRFKSLRDEITDPDERALAMSPNLHSLSILYVYRDSKGNDDYNGAAALRTVTLAPNLKHVRMLGARPASSPGLYRARGRAIEPWKGFQPPIEESKFRKAQLETLSFVCYSNALTCAKLDRWEEVADFSQLKMLNCATEDEAFLRHVAQYHKFPRLEKLRLSLEPTSNEDLDGFQGALEQFFASLNPLRSLTLSRTIHGHLIDVITDRHGPTLKKLSLNPYDNGYGVTMTPVRITAEVMESIASKCPNLTSVDLTLRRSMGDRTETRCYEALGTLTNLKKLNLRLDCTNANAWNLQPEDEWDEFDKKTQTPAGSRPKHYNGHLKRAIINSALDERLVREIWQVVNERRTKDTLESLTIRTYGGSSFANSHPGDLMDICNHVSRSYFLKADIKAEDGVRIVEMSKRDREERDDQKRKHEQVMLEKWGRRGHEGSSWTVFKHLWPFKDDEDWRFKWESWPLQRDEAHSR